MPTKFDWDNWHSAWATGLPKNAMWAKVRTGLNDPVTGEPVFQSEDESGEISTSGGVGDVLRDHHFVSPAIESVPGADHCFCGWVGDDYTTHLRLQVQAFYDREDAAAVADEAEAGEPAEAPKKALKKTPAKKVDE